MRKKYQSGTIFEENQTPISEFCEKQGRILFLIHENKLKCTVPGHTNKLFSVAHCNAKVSWSSISLKLVSIRRVFEKVIHFNKNDYIERRNFREYAY